MHGKYALFSILTMFIVSTIFAQDSAFRLLSPAFTNGATIPSQYTCLGADTSPPLAWVDAPKGTKSLVLIVDDPDAPSGTFVHCVVYDLDSATNRLAENASSSASPIQGVNGFGHLGYGGPCPPRGAPHHYHFRLFALASPLGLKPGASAGEVLNALKGHVLGVAELVGTFGR
jgi:Raf kinase inhibitor-like YbhB/YbcL family protein